MTFAKEIAETSVIISFQNRSLELELEEEQEQNQDKRDRQRSYILLFLKALATSCLKPSCNSIHKGVSHDNQSIQK